MALDARDVLTAGCGEVERDIAAGRADDARHAHAVGHIGAGLVDLHEQAVAAQGESGHTDELIGAAAGDERVGGRSLGHQGGVHRLEEQQAQARAGDPQAGLTGLTFICSEEGIDVRGSD